MNLCKVMQAQAKAMRSTCLAAHSGIAGRARFHVTNNSPAEGKELNNFVTNAVKEIIKSNNLVKAKAENYSGS